MSAALLVVVLVCGYLYINSHIPSKIIFQKSTGWHSYFQVALKGSTYLSLSFVILMIVWMLLFFLSFLLNFPLRFGASYEKFTFATDVLYLQFAGIGLPFILLVSLTALISFGESKQVEKKLRDPGYRRQIFEEIAANNPIESILLESLESQPNLLVSITLSSRKVYVGMVHEARLEEHDTDTVVIIPFLSGYRDKETLSFREEVNYADHYRECGITMTSVPISYTQFRHVIPREQIETVSLFNSEIYQKFKNQKEKSNPY